MKTALINQETTRRQFLARAILTSSGLALLGGRSGVLAAGEPGAMPSQRELVRRAAAQRPDDPWPRGLAHVVLAIPGSQQPEKSYHEPGGSFSPAVGSFGVSIWVKDAAGNLKTSSDTLPINQIQQRFSWRNSKSAPAIATTTPYYEATWSCAAAGATVLELQCRANAAEWLELAVRSVGPAGGPIKKIAWKGKQLSINDRWTLTVEPAPAAVFVGHEGDPGWKDRRGQTREWQGEDGWGCARIEFASGRAARLVVRDSAPARPNPLRYPAVRARIEMDLPDPRFADCLHAQVAHLMMGLLDRRTPPGEPTNYPLAWQRDGVAVVAGLGRAGQLEVASQLARYFAENDFFGGFGSEGDAPGQGLRVMEDVAVRVGGVRPLAVAARPALGRAGPEHGLDGQDTPIPLRGADRAGASRPERLGPGMRAGPRRADHRAHGFRPAGLVHHRRELPRAPRRSVAGPAIETPGRSRALAGRGRPFAAGLAEGPAVAGRANLHIGALADVGRGPGEGGLSSAPPTAIRPATVFALDLLQRGDDAPVALAG
jgi:hypothetical protein